MKKQTLLSYFILSAFSLCSLHAQDLSSELLSIRSLYAPDARDHVFDYESKCNENNEYVIKGITTSPQLKEALIALLKQQKETGVIRAYVDSVKLIPCQSDSLPPYGICRLSVADIRTAPSYAAEMASQSLMGAPMQILEYKRGWYRVRTPDNYLGWINNSSIQKVDKASVENWISAPKVIVITHNSQILSQVDDYRTPVSDVVMGDMMVFKSADNKWTQVSLPDGRSGYIRNDHIRNYSDWYADADPTAENIIALGKTFMGIPYTWGGTSAKMLDCSGFMRTIFFMNGIYLNRDASQQARQGADLGKQLDTDNFLPGDLLFFGVRGDDGKKDRVTHVAVYIGGGEYLHEAGLVHISSFDPTKDNYSKYYDETFLCARRILGYESKNINTKYLRVVNSID
ncbi:MAG: NlpC/P60 family protein [Bacteroidales bacterium]